MGCRETPASPPFATLRRGRHHPSFAQSAKMSAPCAWQASLPIFGRGKRTGFHFAYGSRSRVRFVRSTSKKKTQPIGWGFFLEAPPGIGPGIKVLQTSALPLGYGALYGVRVRNFCYVPVRWSGLRGSNPPPQPWQGCARPNELNPHMVPPVGIEPTTRGFSVLCSTN